MIRWLYSDLVVILCFASWSAITAQYSVSVERPCPMETVTFTCTAPGDSLRWEPSDVSRITIRPTNSGVNVPLMPQPGYTVTLIAFNDTTLTCTLSRAAENGINVSCVDPLPTLALTTIGSSMIRLVDPPGPPSTIRHSTLSSSANEVSVSVQWNPPTETGGRDDLTYTVTVSPPAQLSATVLTSTSVTVTAQYNVDYTISVVATNCAGNSTTAECNFRIGGCPVLTNHTNGAFVPVSSRLPGSTVTIQCDSRYVSAVAMVTCESTLMWSPDPEAIECTSLTTPTPTTPSQINCTAPLSPPRNGTISDHSVPAIPGTGVTFQCDDGLFPEGIMTATCLATGEWDRSTGEIICRNESSSTETSGNVAVVAGSVVGSIVVALLIILMVIVLLVVLREKREDSVRLKSNDSIEMDKFDGEYSELRHDGPIKNSKKPPAVDEEDYNRITHDLNPASLTYDEVAINSDKREYRELRHNGPIKKYQPPAADEEGYNRITHDLNPASLTYDEVTINSDKKIAVNEEGYSVMNTAQGAPRLPGYGQLVNVATVEPVIYAALSSSQSHEKGTATVDHHQVTYATVDSDATRKQEAKTTTLPACPTVSALAPPDMEKLLDIDQALVQIRSMKHKWKELAETMRVPETMIEQIEDSCGINHGGCLTEVIDQWMRSCSGRPTWRELAGHLHNIGEEQLSQELMTIYDTGRLPVDINMKAVPNTVYKYDRAPPPPLPSRAPTTTDDSPGLPKLPSRPPKAAGAAMVPARPPKAAHNNEPPVPARPSKQYAKH